MVGLETNFTGERGLDLALVATRAGKKGTTKLSLDKELGVKDSGSRVEGQALDGWVNIIGGSNGVARRNSEW